MELNEETKAIVQQLGTAINGAVEKSPHVADAIEQLRQVGFELELTIRLEIGLRRADEQTADPTHTLDLTKEDLKTLRRMRIKIDDDLSSS